MLSYRHCTPQSTLISKNQNDSNRLTPNFDSPDLEIRVQIFPTKLWIRFFWWIPRIDLDVLMHPQDCLIFEWWVKKNEPNLQQCFVSLMMSRLGPAHSLSLQIEFRLWHLRPRDFSALPHVELQALQKPQLLQLPFRHSFSVKIIRNEIKD